jgi:O-antigen/teichoic acid export membrane protein
MESKKTIAKEGGVTFLGGGAGAGIRFFSEIVVAHSTTMSEFGIYGLCINFIAILQTFLSGGARAIIQRYVPILYKNKELSTIRKLLSQMLIISLFIIPAFLALLIYYKEKITSLIGNSSLLEYISLISIAVPLLAMIILISDLFRSTGKVKYFSVLQEVIPGSIYLVLLGILYTYSNGTLNNILTAYISSLIITLFIGIYWIKKHLPLPKSRNQENKSNQGIIRFASYSAILYCIWILKERAAIFIIGSKMEAEDVALYFVALRFLMAISLIRGALNSLLLPRISTLYHANDIESLQSTYSMITRWMVMVILPIAIITSFFSGELSSLLFGSEYSDVSSTVMIILFFQILTLLTGPSSIALQMTGRPKDEIVFQLASVIAILFFCSLFIDSFRLEGAAFGVFGSLYFFDIARMIYVHRKIGIKPMRKRDIATLLGITLLWGISFLITTSYASILTKLFVIFLLLIIVATIFWRFMLENQERDWLRSKIIRI